jgi:hypothetical protein
VLVGIRHPQGGEKDLDANGTFTVISFALFLWSIPMYQRPIMSVVDSRTRDEKGMGDEGGVGLEMSLDLGRFLRT